MRLQKYIHPSEKHRDYDSANFKSLTLFSKLILDMILFISVTPFSYPRTKVEKNGDGYGKVDDCKFPRRPKSIYGVRGGLASGGGAVRRPAWKWRYWESLWWHHEAEEKDTGNEGVKGSRRQGNGYIIIHREVNAADRMAGEGWKGSLQARIFMFTDICPLYAPYFSNTGLIHFSLTCERSQYWHPLFPLAWESHKN